MSEKIQRLPRGALALMAAGIAGTTVVANFVHTGKILWGGVVILVLALIAWQRRDRNGNRA